MAKLKVSMTIEERTLAEFRIYCYENGMKMSTKVEQLIRNLVRDKPGTEAEELKGRRKLAVIGEILK